MANKDRTVIVVIEGVSKSEAKRICDDVATAKTKTAPNSIGVMKTGTFEKISANLVAAGQKCIGRK